VPDCAICNGTGWKPVEVDGVRRVERCDCWRAGVASRLMHEARIPPMYARCTLDNFYEYENDGLREALKHARKFVDSFPAVAKGLCLIGPPGIGKTHIAVGALRECILRTSTRGMFYDVRELLKTIRSTYNPVVRTAEMDVLRPVMEAELLVLDDLGAEKPSEWVEETMNLIVNTRYNERRPTIFTSNYEDVPEEGELNSLHVRVGFRLHSRLREMCEFLEYDGPDYRNMPPNAGADDLYKLWKAQPRRKLPVRSQGQVRAQLKTPKHEKTDLKWSGGRAGS